MRRRSDFPAYLALRGAGVLTGLLPRTLALGAGALLGRSARALGLRRRVTDENLAIAFPELSAGERADLAARVFAHFGRMAVDSERLSAAGPRAVLPLVAAGSASDLVSEPLERGRGVIVLTGHIGNWELAGAHLAGLGIPLSAVVKPPSNLWVAAHAQRVRRRLGIETIPMPEARTGVMRALRENRAVALVADQGALRSSIWSPFFGRLTRTPSGPGLFAVRSGAPVIFGAFVATPGGGYELHTENVADKVTGDARTAEQEVADRYRAALERMVRRVPEQYLWTHRLWKQAAPADRDPAAAR